MVFDHIIHQRRSVLLVKNALGQTPIDLIIEFDLAMFIYAIRVMYEWHATIGDYSTTLDKALENQSHMISSQLIDLKLFDIDHAQRYLILALKNKMIKQAIELLKYIDNTQLDELSVEGENSLIVYSVNIHSFELFQACLQRGLKIEFEIHSLTDEQLFEHCQSLFGVTQQALCFSTQSVCLQKSDSVLFKEKSVNRL